MLIIHNDEYFDIFIHVHNFTQSHSITLSCSPPTLNYGVFLTKSLNF